MTSSLINADRSTHMKIAATAIAAASLVVIVGLTARMAETSSDIAAAAPHGVVVKAGSPVTLSSRTGVVVR